MCNHKVDGFVRELTFAHRPQVIAFSSQLLQAEDIEPLHLDYVKLSVKSAEDLLGIINQVIKIRLPQGIECCCINASILLVRPNCAVFFVVKLSIKSAEDLLGIINQVVSNPERERNG